MRGPDEIYAKIDNVEVGSYRCAEYNFWTVEQQPEAALFCDRIGEQASQIDEMYVAPPASRDKLAAIIAELKALRDGPLVADTKDDILRIMVIEEKRHEKDREEEYDAFNKAGRPTWKQVFGGDTYHQFIEFLEGVFQKCDELGKDVVFKRLKNM